VTFCGNSCSDSGVASRAWRGGLADKRVGHEKSRKNTKKEPGVSSALFVVNSPAISALSSLQRGELIDHGIANAGIPEKDFAHFFSFPAKPPRFYIFKTLNFHCHILFFNREP
jgi:hypothetical protein